MRSPVLYHILFVAALLTSANTFAQDSLAVKKKIAAQEDTVKKRKRLDSLLTDKYKSAKSRQKKLDHRTDSIQNVIASPKTFLQSVLDKRKHKKDSLAKNTSDSLTSRNPASDSLKKKPADSTHRYNYKSLDSLQKKFHHRTDSLQRMYASPMNLLQSAISKRHHKRDSLSKRNLRTDSLDHEIDSLQRAQSLKLKELNLKVEQVKKETLKKASDLHLPPEAQKELAGFTKNIDGFKVPSNFLSNFKFAGVPSLNLPSGKIPSLNLPNNLSIPSANIPSLQKLDIKSMQIPSLPQLQGSLGSELKKLQSLKSVDSKAIEKEALSAASQNGEVKSLLKEETQVKDMQKQLSQVKSAKNADSLAMAQLKPAVNHFAGKEKELTAAMDKVSKLKQKYSSVKSLADLPKRAPNPLRDKPWLERLVPGVNYFIMSKRYTLVDLNPYVGWWFNPRFTAALGWNERIGITHGRLRTSQYDRVFGIRATASYLWTHGINFKIAPELMSAWVPTNTPDVKSNEWVFGFYAGVRKDFPIYKSLKGYSEVIYNFTQKPYQNIYGDPVSFRFGMEMRLKKKTKK